MMQLHIGNKNYSSWSMRPWVLMRQFDIPFQEVMIRFDAFSPDSRFKRQALQLSPAGRVPVLVDGNLSIWDTLAIAEYLAETHPHLALWPRDRPGRARARSLCAEMHAGFSALRSHFPQNLEVRMPEIGARVLAEEPAVVSDLARVCSMWTDALRDSSGPFLFGDFSIADAYYAPMAGRLRSYGLPMNALVTGYVEHLFATKAVAAWVIDALQEHDFVAEDEPYRSSPNPAA